jgi:hypothetical protein
MKRPGSRHAAGPIICPPTLLRPGERMKTTRRKTGPQVWSIAETLPTRLSLTVTADATVIEATPTVLLRMQIEQRERHHTELIAVELEKLKLMREELQRRQALPDQSAPTDAPPPSAPEKLLSKNLIHDRLDVIGAGKITPVSRDIHGWMVEQNKSDPNFPVLKIISIANMIRRNKWGWWKRSADPRWPKN